MSTLRPYGVESTIYFPLVDFGANDFEATPVTFASGDTQISKDGGAFANTSNNPAHEGNGVYSLTITATEMQAANIVVTIVDQTDPKAWEDQAALVDTFGNASAQYAFDLDTATQAVDVTSISGDSAAAAENLELDYDGTGYAKSNSTIGTATDVTNQVSADVTAVSGDSTAADNMESDYDGTGYNKSNSTIGTLTTNSDKTGYSISGTKTTLDALNDVSTADVNAQCDTALTDYDAVVPADLPTNFGSLDITAGGQVNVGKIDDSTAAATLLALVYAGAAISVVVDVVTDSGDFTLTGSDLSASNSVYNDMFFVFTSGDNRSVARGITTYTGSTKRVQFSGDANEADEEFPETVSAGDSAIIVGLLRRNP